MLTLRLWAGNWEPRLVNESVVAVVVWDGVKEEVVPARGDRGTRDVPKTQSQTLWGHNHNTTNTRAPDVARVGVHTAPNGAVMVQPPLEPLRSPLVCPPAKYPFDAASKPQHLQPQ